MMNLTMQDSEEQEETSGGVSGTQTVNTGLLIQPIQKDFHQLLGNVKDKMCVCMTHSLHDKTNHFATITVCAIFLVPIRGALYRSQLFYRRRLFQLERILPCAVLSIESIKSG